MKVTNTIKLLITLIVSTLLISCSGHKFKVKDMVLNCTSATQGTNEAFKNFGNYKLTVSNNIATLSGSPDEFWTYEIIQGDNDEEWDALSNTSFGKTGYAALYSASHQYFRVVNMYLIAPEFYEFHCEP